VLIERKIINGRENYFVHLVLSAGRRKGEETSGALQSTLDREIPLVRVWKSQDLGGTVVDDDRLAKDIGLDLSHGEIGIDVHSGYRRG
jgi:hypothetical protein